jgi:predicted O-methyltransferase YrrM
MSGEDPPTASRPNRAAHVFSSDWFSDNIPIWEEHLAVLRGQPNLRFLEIGSYEGRSACWLLETILTDDTSRLDCVDRFRGDYTPTFEHNVTVAGAASKVTKLRGYSQEVLRGLALYSYDGAYIDGSHEAAEVLEDMVLVFRLLKNGGILILDDYEWYEHADPLKEPQLAIDAFLKVFEGRYELLHKAYQVILRKTVAGR